VNRAHLQNLTEERIGDATVLLAGERWGLAYHISGLVIEYALKSCILEHVNVTGWIFDEKAKNKVEDCRTHDFKTLVRTAGLLDTLNDKLKERTPDGIEFARCWQIVSLWAVGSRYEMKTESEAKDLFAAITNDPHGVLKWIQTYW
jgi:hypothetical protein